ncbi:MAG: thiol:disulfide interchange protein DsbA/DsbL [Pseudomonadota bacterium]
MKKTPWLLIALALSACGQDAAETTVETPAEVPEATTDVTEPVEATETAVEETLQVVEESAAEEEPADDKPILLAQAEDAAAERDWKYQEGSHFTRLVPSQPTWGGADKIEVTEFFWYGCGHCYNFEPYINRWKDSKDPGVRLVLVPAMWNPLLEKHARLFFVEQIFARNGQITDPARFRQVVFEEIHRRGNRLASDRSIYELFERVGISREDFDKSWNSFEVDQNIRKARDLARRYSVNSVPTVVVNGKYKSDATANGGAGGFPQLIELIDELSVREGLR